MLTTALPPLPNRALIPLIDIAEWLGIAPTTLRSWVHNGDFVKPLRIRKSRRPRYFFRRCDIVAWLNKTSI
jgi:predicted site-specific integrase-resolvase